MKKVVSNVIEMKEKYSNMVKGNFTEREMWGEHLCGVAG